MLIADGEGEFDQDIIAFSNNFKIKYEQFLEAYNGGHCAMVLIKNVTTTKKDWYLKAQHYTILTKVVDKGIWTLPSIVTQQIIKCSICIQRSKFLSFPLHHLSFFQIYT